MVFTADDKHKVLKTVFGHSSFRSFQEDAVDAILAKKDLMVVLPTGGGKSLCYQLPTLLMDGITVVISPLLALMHDQITALRAFGIEADMVSSMQSAEEISSSMAKAKASKLKFLYAAPERFKSEAFVSFLQSLKINFFVIDEAHCVSEWGHEFREDYRKLYILKERFGTTPIAAFTATATTAVQRDIGEQLRLKNGVSIRADIQRENLFIASAYRIGNGRGQLLEFVSKFKNESGIVYTFTRKEAESLAEFFSSKNITAKAYHAGLNTEQKNETYRAFVNDEIQIVVATVAFGMGIDKSNIRFVAHSSLPKTIENYYQEIGRAGRDGLPSKTLLLFSSSDIVERRSMIESMPESPYKKHAVEKLEAMGRFAASEACRHAMVSEYFGDSGKNCIALCDNCLEPTKESIDITVESLKLLSAIHKSGQRFGLQYVVDILLGSKDQKIEQNGHQTLSVYGIGKEKSRKQWLSIADRLLELKAIRQGEYRVISLDEYALQIIKEKQAVTIRKDRLTEAAKERTNRKKEIYKPIYDNDVFEALRALRSKLAKEANVPPYVVFSDKTLKEMADRLPATKEEMLEVSGVGEVKFERYGLEFLELLYKSKL